MKLSDKYKKWLKDFPVEWRLQLNVEPENRRHAGLEHIITPSDYDRALDDIRKYGEVLENFGPYVDVLVPINKVAELLEKVYVIDARPVGSIETLQKVKIKSPRKFSEFEQYATSTIPEH